MKYTFSITNKITNKRITVVCFPNANEGLILNEN